MKRRRSAAAVVQSARSRRRWCRAASRTAAGGRGGTSAGAFDRPPLRWSVVAVVAPSRAAGPPLALVVQRWIRILHGAQAQAMQNATPLRGRGEAIGAPAIP